MVLPEYRFYAICRECELEKGYNGLSTWPVANALTKHPDIMRVFIELPQVTSTEKYQTRIMNIEAEAYNTKSKAKKTKAPAD